MLYLLNIINSYGHYANIHAKFYTYNQSRLDFLSYDIIKWLEKSKCIRLTTSCEETALPLILLWMVMRSHGNWEISVIKKWNIIIYKYHDKNSD